MKKLSARLALYEKAGEDSTLEAPQPLEFAGFPMHSVARGVYARREEHADFRIGEASFSDHVPLQLSGILELGLAQNPEALHPEDVLILDTETTGLQRGPGTIPFLTGLAWFTPRGAVFEQVLLHEMRGEAAYVDYLEAQFQRFRYLVTYNGKSFDMPLLRNRFVMHGRRQMLPLVHFDLLHVFRRLLARRGARRQQDLELEFLGLKRENDLPGAEIPQIYFDFIRYGADRGMDRVLKHNLEDLKGLTLLLLEAIRIYQGRDTSRRALRSGIARILLRNRRVEEAEELLSEVVSLEEAPGELRYRDLILLGRLLRGRGDYEAALGAFERAVAEYACPFARMSATRLREHRLRDFAGALRETETMLCESRSATARAVPYLYTEQELLHRKHRLERRLLRQNT
ncbi:MAG: ribonuclease H-like domain-containing protein [Spirochaetales bacterium]|nr:ribonuclease H-like domain-containing protein [Leptospiraceae bacterium]MCP5483607.1 ribonuclease H-like domain-containing protein [Spirochaetales bacterium]MCP5484527.1 ribonuclease H-like domain-containing protein [Spirochaetales bacterium]